jgi:hypothetical protein
MRLATRIPTRYPAVALLGLCCALLLAPGHAWGASSQSQQLAEMQRKLDQSLEAIQALTRRVTELEAQLAASKAAAPATAGAPATNAAAAGGPGGATTAVPGGASGPAADNARLEADEQKLEQLERENANRSRDDTGLPLHGFADVGVGTRNPLNPEVKGFFVGNLDFYMTPQLGDRTRALFELNTEVGSDGEVDVDLERAQIGYQFSDLATVWLGRFHTPYGYVNTALHHGAWVNNTLRRPKFLNFEDQGGIMPAHTVGLWSTGALRTAGGRWLYDAYVGNSQHIDGGTLDMQSAGSSDFRLMGGGRLGYQFNDGAIDGLTLGVHALTARVTAEQFGDSITRLLVYGGYAVYDTDRWENIAELYLFDNEDQSFGTGSHRSSAGFVQFGYRTSWGIPYARYERAALSQADPYFYQQSSGNSYWRGALGVRFDLDLKSAIKFELADTRFTDRDVYEYGEGLVQYAIRF